MKAIVILHDSKPVITDVDGWDGALAILQENQPHPDDDVLIQEVHIYPGSVMVVDEDGLLKKLPLNKHATALAKGLLSVNGRKLIGTTRGAAIIFGMGPDGYIDAPIMIVKTVEIANE